MNQLVVRYDGHRLGRLAESRGGVFFEYDPAFLATGLELSPFCLPLSPGVKSRDGTVTTRLPGVFEDSLPDRWGRLIVHEWFRKRETVGLMVTPLMMLAYVGARAMGALSYEPCIEIGGCERIPLESIHDAAAIAETGGPIDLDILAGISGTAGGACPKALLALADDPTLPAWTACVGLPLDYGHWLVKFDTSVSGEEGALEHAFALLARASGIDLPPSRLVVTNGIGGQRRHFAVKRFDRVGEKRIHYHSLAGLNQTGGANLDYQNLLRVTRRLTRDERQVWQAYRRAVFNVLASNRDDHGQNHGFLFQNGEWRLSPAFDLTFGSPMQLPERGMSICGERQHPGRRELVVLAEREGLDRAQAAAVLEEVATAIANWHSFAEQTGISKPLIRAVAGNLGR